jgi:hypothetical protein
MGQYFFCNNKTICSNDLSEFPSIIMFNYSSIWMPITPRYLAFVLKFKPSKLL